MDDEYTLPTQPKLFYAIDLYGELNYMYHNHEGTHNNLQLRYIQESFPYNIGERVLSKLEDKVIKLHTENDDRKYFK